MLVLAERPWRRDHGWARRLRLGIDRDSRRDHDTGRSRRASEGDGEERESSGDGSAVKGVFVSGARWRAGRMSDSATRAQGHGYLGVGEHRWRWQVGRCQDRLGDGGDGSVIRSPICVKGVFHGESDSRALAAASRRWMPPHRFARLLEGPCQQSGERSSGGSSTASRKLNFRQIFTGSSVGPLALPALARGVTTGGERGWC